MTVTAVHKDPDTLTLTLTAEFDAPPDGSGSCGPTRASSSAGGVRLSGRRPSLPRLPPGSHVEYHMTGPTGDQPHGYWDVIEVDPPRRLVFLDGFADDEGPPNADFPRNDVHVRSSRSMAGRTQMKIESRSRASRRSTRWPPWAWRKV